jgi:hypothetical protein
MARACSKHGTEEKYIQDFGEKARMKKTTRET